MKRLITTAAMALALVFPGLARAPNCNNTGRLFVVSDNSSAEQRARPHGIPRRRTASCS